MINTTKIKKILPKSELGEIRPCTAPGKVQFHLLVAGKVELSRKVIDIKKLEKTMQSSDKFLGIKMSKELGVVKASYKGAEISILQSGRVVVRQANDEKHAQELLENLAPMLKDALM